MIFNEGMIQMKEKVTERKIGAFFLTLAAGFFKNRGSSNYCR